MIKVRAWLGIAVSATLACCLTVISDALAERDTFEGSPYSNTMPSFSGRSFHNPGNVPDSTYETATPNNGIRPSVNPGNVPDSTYEIATPDRGMRSTYSNPGNVPDSTYEIVTPDRGTRSTYINPGNVPDLTYESARPTGATILPARPFTFTDEPRGGYGPFGGNTEGGGSGGSDTSCTDCGDTSTPFGNHDQGHTWDPENGFKNK
ncbi:MAG TPA: hypothetical protein P5110_06245 [Candidatus Omnitrophota bacterium]|nr:hypothetical protein [Candidatus Omnitrophota bacterium]HRZ15093.1 hypothetical protein [Candidatus Omnitrophota bacterium]